MFKNTLLRIECDPGGPSFRLNKNTCLLISFFGIALMTHKKKPNWKEYYGGVCIDCGSYISYYREISLLGQLRYQIKNLFDTYLRK